MLSSTMGRKRGNIWLSVSKSSVTNSNSTLSGPLQPATELSYESYLEIEQRRQAIRHCSIFHALDEVQKDILAFQMIPFEVLQGDVLESTDASVYLVDSGQLESFLREEDTQPIRTFQAGDTIGHVEYFSNQEPTFQIRAASDSCRLWKLDRKVLDTVYGQSKNAKTSMAATLLETDADFVAYMERMEKKKSLSKIPFLSHLQEIEVDRLVEALEPVVVDCNEVVIEQDTSGTCMYIIQSGVYECFRKEERKDLFKTYQSKGDYFGELGLFFQRSRAATIQCVSKDGGQLWKLSRDDLFEAVTETSLGEDVYQLIQDVYREESWLEKATQLSLQDWYDLAVVQSRPKKIPVSFHSVVASLTMAAVMATLFPLLNPTLHGADGLPQLFGVDEPLADKYILQLQIVSVVQAIAAVLGLFRLPPNSPRIRRVGMAVSASAVVEIALASLTVLGGHADHAVLDAFSVPGRALSAMIQAWFSYQILDFVDCAISDKNMKGFASVPFMKDRWEATLHSVVLGLIAFPGVSTFLPLLGSYQDFETLALPFFDTTLEGFTIFGNLLLSTWVSWASFFATLQFEKKISANTSLGLTAGTLLFFGWDAAKTFFKGSLDSLNTGESVQASNYVDVYLPQLYANTHFVEIYFGVLLLTFANGLWKLSRHRQEKHVLD